MGTMFEGPTGMRLQKALLAAVSLLAVFLLVIIVQGLLGLRYIGTGINAANTITVSGTGDAYAVPDIGDFTFSVVSQKKTVADAQADATAKINAVTAYLKSAGVDEKDIKTTNYTIYPTYEYQGQVCAADGVSGIYCPPGKQVQTGYEVRQSTEVKVRDTSHAGDLLAGVGGKGATEVSGLSFTVEDPTAVQAQARGKAIAEAKAKADALAGQLGVTLVRVVSFNENTGGYPMPYAYGLGGGIAASDAKAVAPEISTGQNKVTSNVSITYEIR